MKNTLTVLLLLAIANTAHADISSLPLFDADCPGKIAVHADSGGPVTIGGKEAETKSIDDRHFEAKASGITVSIEVIDDDTVKVTAAGKGSNGVCPTLED
jgi:hypothetical protein